MRSARCFPTTSSEPTSKIPPHQMLNALAGGVLARLLNLLLPIILQKKTNKGKVGTGSNLGAPPTPGSPGGLAAQIRSIQVDQVPSLLPPGHQLQLSAKHVYGALDQIVPSSFPGAKRNST